EWFRAEDRPFLNLEYQLLADIQPGDINLDGSVGTPDLAILAGFFLDSGVGYHEGDLNLDGTVNTSDLAILAGFFGEGTGAGIAPGSATVPEPATLAWLAIAGLAAITRRSTSHHA
ncbi:MAG: dockerin type I domain-containing protein, partial [Planctomycetota bacterium]